MARFIITSSEFSRSEIMRSLPVSPARVRTIRLGVPAIRQAAKPRRPPGLDVEGFALVVGDNRPHKNLAALANAWARLGANPPLALVSTGPILPRYPSLMDLARESGAQRVHALGWSEEGEMEWLYQNAAIILFPSRYEGFGFPLVEAYARGCPTIAADIPTLREIGEGPTVFVQPGDFDGWASAVTDLARSDAERGRRRQEALARAASLDYRRTGEHTLVAG
jgi:glycosyltransferase involved in cell wall biosynthesis